VGGGEAKTGAMSDLYVLPEKELESEVVAAARRAGISEAAVWAMLQKQKNAGAK
jgi:hypothetical protein